MARKEGIVDRGNAGAQRQGAQQRWGRRDIRSAGAWMRVGVKEKMWTKLVCGAGAVVGRASATLHSRGVTLPAVRTGGCE